MAPLQGLDRQAGDGVRLVDEASQRADDAFSRLVEQKGALFSLARL
jgi:hypothetical protein